jgi:hypothetical protein
MIMLASGTVVHNATHIRSESLNALERPDTTRPAEDLMELVSCRALERSPTWHASLARQELSLTGTILSDSTLYPKDG